MVAPRSTREPCSVVKILVFIGSLRSESFSRKLARAAQDVAPEGAAFQFTDGRELPLYDQDLDGEEKPPAVVELLERVGGSDALLFITPEFNYGIPGPLKNAIDWASRPAYHSPIEDKPSLIIALSIAPTGGARAELQLATVLKGTATPTFVGPSFAIPAVHEKFDASGALVDDMTKLRLSKTLEDFCAWAETHQV